MPIDERHRQQRSKNWVLLGLLVGFAAIFFCLTIIKLTPAA